MIVLMTIAAALNYLHPENSDYVHAPLPSMADDSYVSGFYYNIYLPVERQNQYLPELVDYFKKYLAGQTPDFLTHDQFKTLSTYALKYTPSNVLLGDATHYKRALVQLKSLRDQELVGSAM